MKDKILQITQNNCQVRLKELEIIAGLLFPRSKSTQARINALIRSIKKLKNETADAENVFWNVHDLQDGKIRKIELVGVLQ